MLSGRTAIAELGMIPSTMHSAVLYQSEIGPRVIMSEYQNIRRCEHVKRLKESLSKTPVKVSEFVRKTRALEQETRDLDVENEQKKKLKSGYGVTSPQELRHMEDDVDTNMLTMEQYLALIQDNNRSGIVKPKIGDDIEFEINGNFIRELRRKLFKGTNDEDAHEHVRRVLEIAVFSTSPVSLTMPLCLECPQHDFNSQRIVHIFYTGLDIPTRIMLDYKGFIPLMTPTQALKSIQVRADHSHNWYDVATTMERINDCSDNMDTKKLKENIHVIQVVEQKKYIGSLEETIIKYYKESIKNQVANDEYIRKFTVNTDLNLWALDTTTKKLQVKAYQLTQMVLTNAGEKVKSKTKMGKKYMKEPVPRDLSVIQPYVPPTPFPRHLKKQKDNPYKTRKTVCMIGCLEKIHKKKDLGDERDMDDGWDITIEDVERLRQILTPTIHTLPNLEPMVQPYMPLGPVHDEAKVVREEELDIPLQDGVLQPLTPQTVHITLPDDDYVAPATNPILDKHFNEFGNELFDMTGVDENGLEKIHKKKAQGDEEDMDDGWDITIEDDYDIPLQDGVMQPLTPQTVHITPPDDDYVAPAANPILDKHLNEFGKEFLI
ncbi:hypothetical protein Tco_0841644 [Tanacetum coccineum]|uniref:Polyprotein n=1 Tax=Tanacetum coccineum TaxID=301880 RepID=A0ABQ5B0G1_9ASTR